MAPDYDALSDGSELTGEDTGSDHLHEEDDDEVMASAPHTPSKKRRRLVRAVADDDEDEDEIAEALEDDGDQLDVDDDVDEDDNDELDEDDEDYDAPSSSKRTASRTSGRTSTGSIRAAAAAGASSTRPARTSTRIAAAPTTPTANAGKKSLRVKLTRTPNSIAAKDDSSQASKARPSRPTAAAATPPAARRAKDASKVKWKPRNSKGKDSDEDEDEIRTPQDDELDDETMDVSRAATVDGEALSASDDEDASEPDEATAAEMQAIIGKTARQLAREGGVESEYVELPMFDPNRKKKLTENEIALRRSETARKRKNQVEKKLEDDKVETINRLLKKQVGRSRNKLPRAGSAEESDEEAEAARKRGREELSRKALKEMPAPLFRYVDRVDGKLLAVPTGPPLVEEVWGGNYVEINQALIQELDAPVEKQGLSEKAQALEEKARKRLEKQKEQWNEDQALEEVWGKEGLYEYKLRSALGQSRKEWIGSRRPPTPEQEEEAEVEEQEAEQEGEQAGEEQAEEAADLGPEDKDPADESEPK